MSALVAVNNVGAGGLDRAARHQRFFDDILDFLHARRGVRAVGGNERALDLWVVADNLRKGSRS